MTASLNMDMLRGKVLTGRGLALEPLEERHRAGLRAAAADETFLYFVTPDFDSWLERSLADMAAGRKLSYAVRRRSDGALVGSSSFCELAPADRRLEIGSTWYTAAARGTAVNPEAKFLMLEAAFAAGAYCVYLRTCSRNQRSRAAILKLGAREDGVLRAAVWMPPSPLREGYFRDSVFYSILEGEWPRVRDRLEARLK
ncbi:MAG TPA: GNAT family protein [Rhizomicrobium sp.]|nr:GNAT family protein [Rhizomicrobium sp.]